MKQAVQIERVGPISPEQFWAEYVDVGRPVILTGIVEHWPAFKRWSPEYFKREFGSTPIGAERQRSKDPREHVGKRHLLQTTLGSLVDRIAAGEEPKHYLSEWMVFEKIPSLADDLGSLDHYQRMRRNYPESLQRRMQLKPTLWFGPAGSYTTLHRDPGDNFLAQIMGHKKVIMFPADQERELYYPWHEMCRPDCCLAGWSPIDVEAPDLERFPLYANATPYECTLGPGEILFIPIHWWHYVSSLDTVISISTWWFRRLRDWRPSTATWVPGRHAIECWLRQKQRQLLAARG